MIKPCPCHIFPFLDQSESDFTTRVHENMMQEHNWILIFRSNVKVKADLYLYSFSRQHLLAPCLILDSQSACWIKNEIWSWPKPPSQRLRLKQHPLKCFLFYFLYLIRTLSYNYCINELYVHLSNLDSEYTMDQKN